MLSRRKAKKLDLSGVADTAIGHFGAGLMALVNGVLLAVIRLAEEGGGFASLDGVNRMDGGFVGLAEEGKFHCGSSLVGALLRIETAAFRQLAGTKVCSCSPGSVILVSTARGLIRDGRR